MCDLQSVNVGWMDAYMNGEMNSGISGEMGGKILLCFFLILFFLLSTS